MTDARVEDVAPDPWGAQGFLANARRLLADGSRAENSAEGRQLLLHSAAMAACDALLALEGRQVVGSDRGHQLRLAEAENLLAGEHSALFERLDAGDADVGVQVVVEGVWEEHHRSAGEVARSAGGVPLLQCHRRERR